MYHLLAESPNLGNYKVNARNAAGGNTESCKQQFLQNDLLHDDYHGF